MYFFLQNMTCLIKIHCNGQGSVFSMCLLLAYKDIKQANRIRMKWLKIVLLLCLIYKDAQSHPCERIEEGKRLILRVILQSKDGHLQEVSWFKNSTLVSTCDSQLRCRDFIQNYSRTAATKPNDTGDINISLTISNITRLSSGLWELQKTGLQRNQVLERCLLHFLDEPKTMMVNCESKSERIIQLNLCNNIHPDTPSSTTATRSFTLKTAYTRTSLPSTNADIPSKPKPKQSSGSESYQVVILIVFCILFAVLVSVLCLIVIVNRKRKAHSCVPPIEQEPFSVSYDQPITLSDDMNRSKISLHVYETVKDSRSLSKRPRLLLQTLRLKFSTRK
ncbi:hypothetical protein BgiMline_031580 [Biomphalaria glabrata]